MKFLTSAFSTLMMFRFIGLHKSHTIGSVGLKAFRSLQSRVMPPTHFSDKQLPPNFTQLQGGDAATTTNSPSPQPIPGEGNSSYESSKSSKSGFNFREITTLLTIFTLSYFAIDNYLTRIKLEKINHELSVINFKNLQLQQTNMNNFKKRKNLQLLNLNSQYNKNLFKLLLHISLLNKQVVELGLTPVSIDELLKYYQDYVLINNSIDNLNFQNIYLSNELPELKTYLPNINEYKFDDKSN